MKKHITGLAVLVTAFALSAATSLAEESPGSKALEEANARMHHAMAIEFSGDVDVDFARSMIPHHQGAIDMAKAVIEHGSDPDIRKLAEEVVAAQEAEITFMREWLAKKGIRDGDTH